ncbi:hypothetical protein GZL_01113 [Streptomyces sp. 769]|nr:hypothetical protein GZL_01113 [Streptomyces sp. 769]
MGSPRPAGEWSSRRSQSPLVGSPPSTGGGETRHSLRGGRRVARIAR